MEYYKIIGVILKHILTYVSNNDTLCKNSDIFHQIIYVVFLLGTSTWTTIQSHQINDIEMEFIPCYIIPMGIQCHTTK